jgi:hypothetical protein
MLELWKASQQSLSVSTSRMMMMMMMMMTDGARSSLISALRRYFLADGSVFQGQWDSAI